MERKTNNTLLWVVATAIILAVAAVVAYMLMNPSEEAETATKTQTDPTSVNESGDDNRVVTSTTIILADGKFEKPVYNVKKGEAVTVKNNSSNPLQFSSGEHPRHLEEPELNMGVLAPGESGTFTPTKVGTWTFHDHLNEALNGTLVVVE